ncbi:MAG: NmrA family NAD(P)-binding protein [Sphingopyxis sp.]|uniref:NmrA family NAD(P)-binding protein n=1 Tax=Sphingopyxis sp. TaxID=1908224 RepID=UPI003D811538
MHIVMGATGHVGSAVAETLLARGEPVGVITHDPGHADSWRDTKAEIIEADVNDVRSLRAAFQRGRRAFLLNPPADVTTDTDRVERGTVANILAALSDSGLEKVVAESTAGAQPGDRIGDLNVLWELEEGLRSQGIPAAINRAPYYFSNWDDQLDPIRETGKLQTMYPADLALPMAAPRDLGKVAADRLLSPVADTGVRYVEGPDRYSSNDVAQAFAEALGRPVEVVVTPREQWEEAFRKFGFSKPAAASYARMTAVSLDGRFDYDERSIRGGTTLDEYIRQLVARS